MGPTIKCSRQRKESIKKHKGIEITQPDPQRKNGLKKKKFWMPERHVGWQKKIYHPCYFSAGSI